ncbi:MAG: hypothetical protein CL878_05235 [Dehalococcoidia bacterium]|nr:hypothetical protein [Dehalococcoidia bacterium]
MDWRLLAQWLVMIVLVAALSLAVVALLGMGAVIAIGMAGADVLAGLPPLLLTAGVAAGLLWWLTRRGWGHGWWLLLSGRQRYTYSDSFRDAREGRADLNLPRRQSTSRPHRLPDADRETRG